MVTQQRGRQRALHPAHLPRDECQWFLTALSVLPGRKVQIVLHRLPYLRCAASITASSSFVKGPRTSRGSSWLIQRKRHDLPERSGRYSAIAVQFRGPCVATSWRRMSSSSGLQWWRGWERSSAPGDECRSGEGGEASCRAVQSVRAACLALAGPDGSLPSPALGARPRRHPDAPKSGSRWRVCGSASSALHRRASRAPSAGAAPAPTYAARLRKESLNPSPSAPSPCSGSRAATVPAASRRLGPCDRGVR